MSPKPRSSSTTRTRRQPASGPQTAEGEREEHRDRRLVRPVMLAATFQDYVTEIIGGIGSGSVLFLVASGLTLIFGTLRVINFAHGGLYLIGGYLTYTIQNELGFSNAVFWIVVLLASLGVALCGLGLEVGFFRPIYR